MRKELKKLSLILVLIIFAISTISTFLEINAYAGVLDTENNLIDISIKEYEKDNVMKKLYINNLKKWNNLLNEYKYNHSEEELKELDIELIKGINLISNNIYKTHIATLKLENSNKNMDAINENFVNRKNEEDSEKLNNLLEKTNEILDDYYNDLELTNIVVEYLNDNSDDLDDFETSRNEVKYGTTLDINSLVSEDIVRLKVNDEKLKDDFIKKVVKKENIKLIDYH